MEPPSCQKKRRTNLAWPGFKDGIGEDWVDIRSWRSKIDDDDRAIEMGCKEKRE